MSRILETYDVPRGPWRRLVLELGENDPGCQLYLFADPDAEAPREDYWFDTVQQAKDSCRDEWGAPEDSWRPAVTRIDFLKGRLSS